MATTYTVTNTFVADTTAVASEVNQNFTDVLTALNSFDASNLSSGTVPLARIAGLVTTNFAANVVDTDGTLAANSDTRMSSQKAIKTYADAAPSAKMTPTSYTGGQSVTHANGLIFKQGFVARSGTFETITFDVAFPTDVVSCSATVSDSSSISVSNGNVLTDTFNTTTLVIYINPNTDGANWQAWGY